MRTPSNWEIIGFKRLEETCHAGSHGHLTCAVFTAHSSEVSPSYEKMQWFSALCVTLTVVLQFEYNKKSRKSRMGRLGAAP